jgi:hypothetical protein
VSIFTSLFSSDESERLANRRELRKRIAQNQQLNRRIGELRSAIADADRELDLATDRHASTTAPIQGELQSIEARILSCLTERIPASADDESRRVELLADLDRANLELQTTADLRKRRAELVQKEIGELERQRDPQALEMFLANDRYGNPDLLDRKWQLGHESTLAAARVEAAQKHVRENEQLLASAKNPRRQLVATLSNMDRNGNVRPEPVDSEAVAIYSRRLRRWRLELEASQAALRDVRGRAEAVYQELLEE